MLNEAMTLIIIQNIIFKNDRDTFNFVNDLKMRDEHNVWNLTCSQ